MSVFTPALSAPPDDDDERSVEADAGRYRADRVSVAALLRISEESGVTEEGPYEWSVESGWDEAIQGWAQCPPLSCLFHTQRKGKKCKTEEKDFHCLLCIDAMLMERPDSEHLGDTAAKSFKSNPSPTEDPRPKGFTASALLARKGSSQHVGFGYRETEEQILGASENAGEQVDSLYRTAEGGQLHLLEETPLQMYNVATQWPLVRDTCHNVAQTINGFSILPAVRPAGSCNPRSPSTPEKSETTFGRATAHRLAAEAGPPATGEKAGAERSQEITADMLAGTAASENGTRPLPCSWPLHPGRNLLTTFSVCVPKGEEPPFSSLVGTVPRVIYPFGRYVKQEDLSTVAGGNGQSQKFY
ncbi:hypothetical protein Z043_120068, partial [Scleropages formosus]